MKYGFTILFFMTALLANGQTTMQPEIFNFASKEFKVPANCHLRAGIIPEQKPVVSCEGYSISWFPIKNPSDKMLKFALEEASKDMTSAKNFRRKAITVYLLGKEASAYQTSFEDETAKQTRHSIVAVGRVNGQSLLLQLVTEREVKTNDDLADFAKQIIKLSK